MALLDKLLHQFETILAKQKELETENIRLKADNLKLKEEIRILKQTEKLRKNINQKQEENIQELALRLKKLLSA